MSENRAELLRTVPLFQGLGQREIDAVLKATREVDHPAGATITGEDKSGVGFHLILSGEATVSRGGLELAKLAPGEFFGEMALIDGQPRSATVTAVGPVRTLSIVAWSFEPLLTEHPAMAIALLRELCARLRRAEASIVR